MFLPAGMVEVVELKNLAPRRVRKVMRQLVTMVNEVWGHCTDDFACTMRAEDVLSRRLDASDEALFVALGRNDRIAGTASIGSDDFYDGFSQSNGVQPGYVGRDLYAGTDWRGVVVGGLKVWEHLLQARLLWIARRYGNHLTIFTEPGPIDLPALYGRLGAVVLRRGLNHRALGEGSITMLGYPVQETLQRLAALQQSRLAAVDIAQLAPEGIKRMSAPSLQSARRMERVKSRGPAYLEHRGPHGG